MLVSFGDFKPNEISQLIENKDPLCLNLDIESYSTTKNNAQINAEKPDSDLNMEYDAILHYLKIAPTLKTSNVNNNADSNKEKK